MSLRPALLALAFASCHTTSPDGGRDSGAALDGPSVDLAIAPTCNDGMRNGDESDRDCGGSCGPCGDGQRCGAPGDCGSKVCKNGVCVAPSCTDGIANGNETDL